MNIFKPIFLFLILAVVSGCPSSKTVSEGSAQNEGPGEVTGKIKVTGAYALFPLIKDMAESFMALHPGIMIEVSSAGTGEGITDILTKKSDLAMISRPLSDEEINQGIWAIPVAKDGVAPIINQRNPYIQKLIDQGLTPEEFLRLFTSDKPPTWGEVTGTDAKEKVIVYTRADESGAAEIWARFLYKKPSDLRGVGVSGDDEMVRNVQGNPLAIGYCNFSYAFDIKTGERIKDIQIVPADLDFDNKIERKEMPFSNLEEAHRSLWLGFYPDNLCRELSIGSLGKPTDQVIVEFIRYMLGDGQASVKKMGFCPLNNVYLNYALDNLK